jgi:hypothetical protein
MGTSVALVRVCAAPETVILLEVGGGGFGASLPEAADFIVLSNALTKVPPSEYTETQVLRTVIGGRTVNQAPSM